MTASRPSRRRAQRRIGAATLLLALPFGLAACDPREAGSAAVVGTTRITETQVDQSAQAVVDALGKAGVEEPDTAELLRAQVELEVDDQIVAVAQARQGIVVTQGQIDQLISESGGRALLDAQLLQQAGLWLPPGELDSLARAALVQQALGPKLAPNGTQDEQTKAVNAYLVALAKEIGVNVSARYGTWDPATLKIAPVFDQLSRPAHPSASPSASPSTSAGS